MSDEGEEWKGEPASNFADFDRESRARFGEFYMGYFILDAEGNPKPIADVLDWARWFETAERHLAQTLVGERIWVSTIFLGLDHNLMRQGPPRLWETMSFWHGEYLEPTHCEYELNGMTRTYDRPNPKVEIPDDQERYGSREAALNGHARHVAIAERLLQELDAKQGAGFGKTPTP